METQTTQTDAAPSDAHVRPSLAELTRVSLKVGLLSFGGPAAQISVMHQEFVENRKWLNEAQFLHALNFCMLLPGPEAQQLATYCGWLNGRTLGGMIAGILFILPGALAMALVSYVYAAFGETQVISAVFYGVKAGILAIVLQALLKIGQKALRTPFSWAVCAASFCALFFFAVPFPVVILTAALLGTIAHATSPKVSDNTPSPATLPPSLSGTIRTVLTGIAIWVFPPLTAFLFLAPENVLLDLAEFFSLLAVVSFGGAYALLSYMAQVAVETKSWLSAGEMLDGLGLAETTPGPLILVTQFVGFMAGWRDPAPFSPTTGALLAAAMTTWVTFAPSFLFVLAGAPWMEKVRGNQRLAAALSAITAAVAGTILNLAIWFAINVLFADTSTLTFGVFETLWPDVTSIDPVLAAISCLAVILLFVAKRGMLTVLGVSAALGLTAKMLFG